MKKNIFLVIFAMLSGFVGAGVYDIIKNEKQDIYIHNSNTPTSTSVNLLHGINSTSQLAIATEDFVYASSTSTPYVVFIKTISAGNYDANAFEWFFGNGGGANAVTSAGSGVIFSEDGYIITNNHVIEKSEKIEVVHEKKTYTAKIIGRDPSTDLAVLKIEGKNLPAVKFGVSKNIKVGEWVLAVGNPFNLNSTVTAGIVSAKGRNINIGFA